MKKGLNYKLDLEDMNFHAVFYCPNCKHIDLMVDSDTHYINKKPYGYYCLKCKRRFSIEYLPITLETNSEGKS